MIISADSFFSQQVSDKRDETEMFVYFRVEVVPLGKWQQARLTCGVSRAFEKAYNYIYNTSIRAQPFTNSVNKH